jgi:F-type H+/Na+-transporting ATPase subunit beta
MQDQLSLNVSLLRRRVPNLTTAAKAVGLRPATVSNLCTGKISVGRAEVRTLVTLANLANCSLDELIIQGGKLSMIETGIKSVDLFAPIVKGGINGFVARAQVGQLVVLAEITQNLKEKGFETILWAPDKEFTGLSDLEGFIDAKVHSIEDAFAEVSLRDEKEKIILQVDRSFVVSGDLYQLRERFEAEGYPDITTILFDPSGTAVDEDDPYGPLDTMCYFDIDLASRGIYPAIHPVQSTSLLVEEDSLEDRHSKVNRKAKKLLRRYKEIRVLLNSLGKEKLPEADLELYTIGERLEAYLSQPFYVAEEFTKVKGERVSVQDSIKDIEKILAGDYNDVKPAELKYKGKVS